MNTNKKRIVYFSHGGGPLPLMGDPAHKAMIEFMKVLPEQIERPELILVISAHWEERVPTLLGSPNPPMFYDYYGFPPETYEVNYPAPGAPDKAAQIARILVNAGIPSQINPTRGYDHGHFIPLLMMYPQADIPTLQLSLTRGLDPEHHLQLGEALRPLLNENILIIGSGFSFHNMSAFSWLPDGKPDPANDLFQDWLIEVNTHSTYVATRNALHNWEEAPSARYCHPREEHLLPMLVCAGLAQKPAEVIFDDQILGKRSLAFGW
jgi:aromatic ring-opening dioxygenase catalytic subunit (LigB family)